MFAFCAPSCPLQPPVGEGKQVSSMWFWSLGAGGTELQRITPKPCHVVMLPQETFPTAATGNFNYSTINNYSLFHSPAVVHDDS